MSDSDSLGVLVKILIFLVGLILIVNIVIAVL